MILRVKFCKQSDDALFFVVVFTACHVGAIFFVLQGGSYISTHTARSLSINASIEIPKLTLQVPSFPNFLMVS